MLNRLANFLILCAGASQDILKECPNSERVKQVGIGGTILLTATLAFFSGSYALYTIFENTWLAVAFGIVWALVIFNLDRLIVSSMKKTEGWWNQLKMAFPRLLLAFFIAIVISKPLEIRLLETKIEKVLFQSNKEAKEELSENCRQEELDFDGRIKAKRDEVTKKENAKPAPMVQLEEEIGLKEEERKKRSSTIRKKNAPISAQIARLESELQFYRSNSQTENQDQKVQANRREIQSLKSRIASNRRPLRRIDEDIKALNDQREEEFAYYQEELDLLRNQTKVDIDRLQADKAEALEACKETQKKGNIVYSRNSLPDLLVALNKATSEDQIMSRISLFIVVLFIMLETAPVFVKWMMPRGPYDEILAAKEHEVKINALELINTRNHKLNKEIELLTSIDQTEMEQEISNNKKVLKTISDAHHELIKEQVNIWLEKEKSKLVENGVDRN